MRIFAQRPSPLVPLKASSISFVQTDDAEKQKKAKEALAKLLAQIETLQNQLKAADEAVNALLEQVAAAKVALAANAAEREAHERTLKIAETAIKQQQDLIVTYEGAIKTLTTLVELTMKRVDVLEKKLDKANGRSAILGVVLTAVGVLASLKRVF
jgi:chromosome segregation ATPase